MAKLEEQLTTGSASAARPADPAAASARRASLRRWIPRPEAAFLLVAAGLTAGAKLLVVRRLDPPSVMQAWAELLLPDLIFFSAVGLLFCLLYMARRPRLVARLTMLAGLAVLVWGVLNAAWMMATGVQLQPGVLMVLLRDPVNFFPVVGAHLVQRLPWVIPLVLAVVGSGAWLLWRLVRPLPLRRPPLRLAGLLALALVVFAGLGAAATPQAQTGYASQVMGFSSHWSAITDTLTPSADVVDVDGPGRHLPRLGERGVHLPEQPAEKRPNVVIILLESVSWEASSFSGRHGDTTPALARLAREGVLFERTSVPVALTSKAFWATYTGSTPDIQSDYAEAVLVDQPYESIASILGSDGYRTAFFQMSKGAFECAPGLFANLDFDHAWFRENLEDPSANLGYLGGDDFRMIEPMFEWVDAGGDEPFLLTMISSAAHDPYEVPAWYGEVEGQPFERYLHAVRYTDAFVAAVREELERRDLLDETILCVLGDHGEDFRPESRTSRWAPFDEVLRIPWVMRWPGVLDAGRAVIEPCSQLDVTPTILAALGAAVDDAGFDGLNALAPIDPGRRIYFAGWYPESPRGFVENGLKVVYWPYNGTLMRYDLSADPDERAPILLDARASRHLIDDIERWRRESHLVIPPKRFRERFLYDHWRAFSSGRSCWAYYVP